MPKIFTSKTQKIGKFAEDAVAGYLQEKGYEIVEQNYTRKWGEIDVIARDNVTRVTHFVEVKAVSREAVDMKLLEKEGEYRPEDNMHPSKVKRLKTTIQSYIMSVKNDDKGHDKSSIGQVGNDFLWQFDLMVVYIDNKEKKMFIKPLWNIIL